MQKSLKTALNKVKVSLARSATMAKEREAVTPKYDELRSCVEQRVGFTFKEMALWRRKLSKRRIKEAQV